MRIELEDAVRLEATPAIRLRTEGLERVLGLVSRHRDVPLSMLLNKSRCRVGVARTRQLAMYLAHVVLGISQTDIGIALGRDRKTVSYACALIEDMRDDPVFDAEIAQLETNLEDAAG